MEIIGTMRWIVAELEFTSERDLPFDASFYAYFTAPDGTVMRMPGFWDGGRVWKVRFAPTETGLWRYATVCGEKDNGLHGKTGLLECVPYEGSLEIYRRGFVRVEPGKRYFTYGDGTPFFYLGDTHWSMPAEPFETMFKSVVDARAEKGFTVFQSEPIGAKYSLAGGFKESDLEGFRDLDRRFAYIAEKGLVHANAQLVFADALGSERRLFADGYIESLARHWVARYAAYPVMWTTAQEADKDFYSNRHHLYNSETNPWRIVFNAVHKYDPYNHPHSAHQENTGWTRVGDSSFKDLPGHDWFAAQWTPAKNACPDFGVARDYWASGKPVVNYEGQYENLWTKEFGARVQGWTAFLNGMYGHGYGAIDIWLYESKYDADTTSNDGICDITPEDKGVKWTESVNFNTPAQLKRMKDFLCGINWWLLVPACGDPARFAGDGSYYSAAYEEGIIYIAYFYNRDLRTGAFKGLDAGEYEKVWFNPVSGEKSEPVVIKTEDGTHVIGGKPDENDWVVFLRKA